MSKENKKFEFCFEVYGLQNYLEVGVEINLPLKTRELREVLGVKTKGTVKKEPCLLVVLLKNAPDFLKAHVHARYAKFKEFSEKQELTTSVIRMMLQTGKQMPSDDRPVLLLKKEEIEYEINKRNYAKFLKGTDRAAIIGFETPIDGGEARLLQDMSTLVKKNIDGGKDPFSRSGFVGLYRMYQFLFEETIADKLIQYTKE